MKIYLAIGFLLLAALSLLPFWFLLTQYAIIPPENINLSNLDWGGLGTIATLLTVLINIVLLITVFFGFQSVREGQAARIAQILVWATKQMDDIKEFEHKLVLAPDDYTQWDHETRLAARKVNNAYQRLSYFCDHGLIPEAHIRNIWGLNLVYAWTRLENMINDDRRKSGDVMANPVMRREFERVAKRYSAHFDKQNSNLLSSFKKNRQSISQTIEPPMPAAPEKGPERGAQ